MCVRGRERAIALAEQKLLAVGFLKDHCVKFALIYDFYTLIKAYNGSAIKIIWFSQFLRKPG